MEREDFKDYVGQQYQLLCADGTELSLKLIEYNELPEQSHSDVRRHPFSLLFESSGTITLPPLRYELIAPTKQKVQIFMQAVVGSNQQTTYYESIFN